MNTLNGPDDEQKEVVEDSIEVADEPTENATEEDSAEEVTE
jgi:hypothetical protein